MKLLIRILALVPVWLLMPAAASAQDNPASCKVWERLHIEGSQLEKGHFRMRGQVHVTCDQFNVFAEQVDVYTEQDRLTAHGNVLFTSPETRITASRIEFDLKTKTGTFYDAAGTARVKPTLVDSRSMFGTQEAEMQFRGEKLERLSEKKYRLTNGMFTSCLQPTARWEFVSGRVTLNIDNYVVARNTTFRVKGVPLFWLPIIYYPMQEDDRATGFLMPGYGNSQFHGHTMRNAFFWAIGRSMDATFEHNLFSKSGQAFNAELRYVASLGSRGDLRFSLLDEKAHTIRQPDGFEAPREGARSIQIRGGLTQQLPRNFRLGATADYTSDITARQLYQQNFNAFSNAQSGINANVSGSIAGLQVGALFARNEIFQPGGSYLTGSAPRLTVSRAEQPIGNLPIYWAVTGEAVGILAETRTDAATENRNRTRLDLQPTIRAPLSKLPWLNVTTSLAWRTTWWSRSLVEGSDTEIADEPLSRQFFEFRTNLTGPIFGRIFDTPGFGYAQRWKHVVEPALTLSRTSNIEPALRDRIIPGYDGSDYMVGGATSITYAVTNRLYAKRGDGAAARVRELASLTMQQTYATDPLATLNEQNYLNTFTNQPLSNKFTPIRASLRFAPTDANVTDVSADFDTQFNAFRQIAARTSLRIGSNFDMSAGWSQTRFIQGLPGFDNPAFTTHFLSTSSSLRTTGNKYGLTGDVQYDLKRDLFLNQRVTAYYNAQCCGVGIEFQQLQSPYGFSKSVRNRQFNVSFTLAGIGSFSDFFGAFGADPYRR